MHVGKKGGGGKLGVERESGGKNKDRFRGGMWGGAKSGHWTLHGRI